MWIDEVRSRGWDHRSESSCASRSLLRNAMGVELRRCRYANALTFDFHGAVAVDAGRALFGGDGRFGVWVEGGGIDRVARLGALD